MVQSMVARRALDMQLKRVGILPPGEGIHDLAEFELVFKSLCECLCVCARACVRIFRTRARARDDTRGRGGHRRAASVCARVSWRKQR